MALLFFGAVALDGCGDDQVRVEDAQSIVVTDWEVARYLEAL